MGKFESEEIRASLHSIVGYPPTREVENVTQMGVVFRM